MYFSLRKIWLMLPVKSHLFISNKNKTLQLDVYHVVLRGAYCKATLGGNAND